MMLARPAPLARLLAAAETLPPNVRGAVLMAFSGAAYAGMIAVIRSLASEIHPIETVFFRALMGLVVILPFFLRNGLDAARTDKLPIFGLRACIQVAAQLCYFFGVSIVPMAAAMSLGMTHAIFVAAGAVIFLGEPSVPKRWFAVIWGFIGALVIIRPDGKFFADLIHFRLDAGIETASVELGAILVVLATVGYATITVHAKVLTRTEPVPNVIAWTLLFAAPISLIFASFFWEWPTMEQLFWLFMVGALGTLGNASMTRAFKIGEMTVLAPVMYIRLIWAALLGFIFFSELPSAWTWSGAAMIASAGIYLSRLEHRRAKSAAAAREAAR
jgi:drug/metabolite transporter (DMT)-like permease